MAEPSGPNAGCPRCGAAFHCGARDRSCACAQLQLDEPTLFELRQTYQACLCLACLRDLMSGCNLSAAQDKSA